MVYEQYPLASKDKTVMVLVGSTNPVKLEAVREAFLHFHPNIDVLGFDVDSKVSVQPVGDETFSGAKNRAEAVMELEEDDADFYVGAEGGIVQHGTQWFTFACMCIINRSGNMGYGITPQLPLPDEISNRLLTGEDEELGDIIDELTGQAGTKFLGGSTEFFTKGRMDRKQYYIQGLLMALVPFIHDELYFD